MKVRVRVIKAISDRLTTEKYVNGHYKVLETYGVTKVTSADTSWTNNPNVYLIVVEAVDDQRLLGGARIQLNSKNAPLPLETAIRVFDRKIIGYMEDYKPLDIAEFCGLWNSIEVAGYGIGSIYLGRVGVAICSQLGIKKLIALASPATLRNCKKVGFDIIRSLGNEGKFFYPKEGLIATVLEISDLNSLPLASEEDRDYIFSLRSNLQFNSRESGPKGSLQIAFELQIQKIHENNSKS